MKNEIDTLAKKAAEAEKSEEAMRYSQSALNLAHVKATLHNITKEEGK